MSYLWGQELEEAVTVLQGLADDHVQPAVMADLVKIIHRADQSLRRSAIATARPPTVLSTPHSTATTAADDEAHQ